MLLSSPLPMLAPPLPALRALGRALRSVSAGTGKADAWSDERLVEAIVQNGSRQHFGMLLARYRSRVHQLALSVLGPSLSSHAEDVAQEVFIRLFRRLHQFRGDCAFSTWVYRLAINVAIDYRRSAGRHRGLEFDEARLPVRNEDSTGVDRGSAAQARIQGAIRELPEAQRMMVHLHYWLDLKMREIAEVLDCPEGTVKVYLRRARLRLAELLEEARDE